MNRTDLVQPLLLCDSSSWREVLEPRLCGSTMSCYLLSLVSDYITLNHETFYRLMNLQRRPGFRNSSGRFYQKKRIRIHQRRTRRVFLIILSEGFSQRKAMTSLSLRATRKVGFRALLIPFFLRKRMPSLILRLKSQDCSRKL